MLWLGLVFLGGNIGVEIWKMRRNRSEGKSILDIGISRLRERMRLVFSKEEGRLGRE